MLPLRDNVPTRRFPAFTVALILANVAVWVLYQIPEGLQASVTELGYRPCELEGTCDEVGQPWPVNALTSMFTHGSWAHIAGNMLFLWIFGNNIEDALGKVRFLLFYVLAGLAALFAQTAVTLTYGDADAATIPNVGASGAIAGVLGAYLVLFPRGRVTTWIFPVFFIPVPAFLFLGGWFLFQLWAGSASMTEPAAGGGIAYFAHVGGFAFGFLLIRFFMAGRRQPLRPANL